jgi:hypothetical protein
MAPTVCLFTLSVTSSALNLNIHFHEAHPCASPLRGSRWLCKSAFLPIYHMLYLDGVYAADNYGKTRFDDEHPCSPPYGQPLVVQIHSR